MDANYPDDRSFTMDHKHAEPAIGLKVLERKSGFQVNGVLAENGVLEALRVQTTPCIQIDRVGVN